MNWIMIVIAYYHIEAGGIKSVAFEMPSKDICKESMKQVKKKLKVPSTIMCTLDRTVE